jgi:coniferyl-aldehyde dehydrogenase
MKDTDDQAAIARLLEIFDLQKAAYRENPEPSLAERLDLLARIPPMIMANAKRIAEALNADFGYHNELTAYMFDVLNVAERAQYAASQLESWMQRDERPLEPALYGSSRAYIEQQPKGVIGNMPAWNFPVDLSVGPLVEMLAAGNRVIIKPSEQTPAVGALLEEILGEAFPRDRVAVVNGGLDLARHFSTMRWDHLLYTGNTTVGREVMANAAKNLVPVTLELGGRNPTVFTEDAVTRENVAAMLGTKLCKNGQLCITVNHVLIPASTRDSFIGLVREVIENALGDYTTSADVGCAVINQKQMDRVQHLLDDARTRDPDSLIEIGSPADPANPCRTPLTLVIDPSPAALVCTQEVFGPILPVKTYENFDEVITQIQADERPLGIYIFSNQPELIERLRRNTSSGGFCVNAAALQGAQANLGFGGVGNSGMGRHHGIEGFREFSNPRGVVEVAADAQLGPIYSPHGEQTRQFVRHVTGGMLG